MARFKCPQCGRRFGSVGEVLEHTQSVHAHPEPYAASGGEPAVPARAMPAPEPGPVATERASQAGFEPRGADDIGTFERGPLESGGTVEAGDDSGVEKQSSALGTVIALVVIAIIIILNILGGSPE